MFEKNKLKKIIKTKGGGAGRELTQDPPMDKNKK
jgi:hypothetical protein